MAGKKKQEKEIPKRKKGKGRKFQESEHSNNEGEVNKSQAECSSSDETHRKRAKRSSKMTKGNDYMRDDLKDQMKESNEINSEESNRNVTRMVVNENEEVMQMEVEADQEEFLGESLNEELDYEQEIVSSDDDEEGEMDFSTNNNACMSEDEGISERKNESDKSFGRSLSTQEKEEIKADAYDKAMDKMKECMQEVMSNSGLMETAQLIQEQLKKGAYMDSSNSQGRSTMINIKNQAQTKSKGKLRVGNNNGIQRNNKIPVQVDSEITIYRNAVYDGINKRSSSSSEEGYWLNDTSDEHDNSEENVEGSQINKVNADRDIDNFISEARRRSQEKSRQEFDEVQPLTSEWRDSEQYDRNANDRQRPQPRDRTPMHAERADEVVQEVEARRARIFDLPGKQSKQSETHELINKYSLNDKGDFVHSAMVDESYMLVAAHLEENLQKKIVRGEYVDFSRLLPRDRMLDEEEETMQMIVKDRQTFWRTTKNWGDPLTVNNVHRWEQAFRVYSDVYLRAHPARASELIQYNHIIHTTAATYIWDNVYTYDKDFRLHLSRFPNRNWGIILQQAWNFHLKEKLRFNRNTGATHQKGRNNSTSGDKNTNDICKQFNRTGRCSFGKGCKYEHRCYFCGKFGHPIIHWRQFKYGGEHREYHRDRDRYDYHDKKSDKRSNNGRDEKKIK